MFCSISPSVKILKAASVNELRAESHSFAEEDPRRVDHNGHHIVRLEGADQFVVEHLGDVVAGRALQAEM